MAIKLLDIDFASGQEPEDPDEVATLVRLEAEISGKDLARMLGKQQRMVGRFLEKADPRSVLRLLLHGNGDLERLNYYAVGFVKKYLWEEFQDRETELVAELAVESDLPYTVKLNPRTESVVIEIEFEVTGE